MFDWRPHVSRQTINVSLSYYDWLGSHIQHLFTIPQRAQASNLLNAVASSYKNSLIIIGLFVNKAERSIAYSHDTGLLVILSLFYPFTSG